MFSPFTRRPKWHDRANTPNVFLGLAHPSLYTLPPLGRGKGMETHSFANWVPSSHAGHLKALSVTTSNNLALLCCYHPGKAVDYEITSVSSALSFHRPRLSVCRNPSSLPCVCVKKWAEKVPGVNCPLQRPASQGKAWCELAAIYFELEVAKTAAKAMQV